MAGDVIGLEPGMPVRVRTPGEKLEGVAFTFCKAATICLIAGKYALPVAAVLAAVFYVFAYAKGKHETRCVLRLPLVTAAFWSIVAAAMLYVLLAPSAVNRFPFLAWYK